ncbi:MAG: GNAT family N-acetyltransferase [Actinomycetota bacterium]
MSFRLESPSTPSQYEDWARIMELVSGQVFGVEELTHALQTDRDSAWILAYSGDEALGSGVGRPSSIEGSQYSMARVLPEHRRQGVGTAFYRAISEHARTAGKTSLWGRVHEEDEGSRQFAKHHGFEEVGRDFEVVLELADVDTSREPPPGVDLVSIAERPDLVRAVYDVECEVSPEVPRPPGYAHAQPPFERWHADYLEGPGAMPEALVVALVDGEPVGYAGMRRKGAASPVGENMLTAVKAPFRSRGIATALKLAQIERARAAGVEQLFTTNDEDNLGMRAVNEHLGYKPLPVEIIVSGPLAT